MKKAICIILSTFILLTLCSCGKSNSEIPTNPNPGVTTKLSFKEAASIDSLKALNGSTVSISGYMATSSPTDGSFMFLMNLPYQSCPFCVPNTSQLSNTLECYPKEDESFDFTNQAIRVTGTLLVAEDEDKPFEDMYGYTFNFKIIDSDYVIIDEEELGEELAIWQDLANTDVISEVYNMFNYVTFLCSWNTYYVQDFTDETGAKHKGYYLYASDALNYIQKEEGQYHYGIEEGYFEGIINTIKSVDPEAFSDLVKCVEDAKVLADEAYKELVDGNYTYEYQYVEMFEKEDNIYTITNGDRLCSEMDRIYAEFTDWLSGWEM